MNINDANKTEKAILAMKEQLDNVYIPSMLILDKINYEMRDIFMGLIALKHNIMVLENNFGSLDQYGIADELSQYIEQ